MEVFGISIKGTIKPNIRVLVIPTFLIGMLIILTLVVFKNGFTRISFQLKKLKEAERTENMLKQKVDVLENLKGVVLDKAEVSVIALPEKNPTMFMFAQLRNSADKYLLTILDREARGMYSPEGDLSKMELRFRVRGDHSNIIDFLREIKDLAPLSTVEEVSISIKGNLSEAEVTLFVYWGDFPEKIPPLTEPVRALTEQEEEAYQKIAKLTKPEFIELNPVEKTDRENPFR